MKTVGRMGIFLKSAEGIATNILAARLQALEENQLMVKLDHPDSKANVLYKVNLKAIIPSSKMKPLPASEAAEIIIESMENNKYRIMVGKILSF